MNEEPNQDLVDLRDLHAGFAMMGILASTAGHENPPHLTTEGIATFAYKLADAMREARTAGTGIAGIKA